MAILRVKGQNPLADFFTGWNQGKLAVSGIKRKQSSEDALNRRFRESEAAKESRFKRRERRLGEAALEKAKAGKIGSVSLKDLLAIYNSGLVTDEGQIAALEDAIKEHAGIPSVKPTSPTNPINQDGSNTLESRLNTNAAIEDAEGRPQKDQEAGRNFFSKVFDDSPMGQLYRVVEAYTGSKETRRKVATAAGEGMTAAKWHLGMAPHVAKAAGKDIEERGKNFMDFASDPAFRKLFMAGLKNRAGDAWETVTDYFNPKDPLFAHKKPRAPNLPGDLPFQALGGVLNQVIPPHSVPVSEYDRVLGGLLMPPKKPPTSIGGGGALLGVTQAPGQVPSRGKQKYTRSQIRDMLPENDRDDLTVETMWRRLNPAN